MAEGPPRRLLSHMLASWNCISGVDKEFLEGFSTSMWLMHAPFRLLVVEAF
jgi:hypothetical protein